MQRQSLGELREAGLKLLGVQGLPEPAQSLMFRVSSCSYRPPVGTQFQLRVAFQ